MQLYCIPLWSSCRGLPYRKPRNWRTEDEGNTQKSSGQHRILPLPSQRIAISSIRRRLHLLQPQALRSLIPGPRTFHRLSLHPPPVCPLRVWPIPRPASVSAVESRPHRSSAKPYPKQHYLQRARTPRRAIFTRCRPPSRHTSLRVSTQPPARLGAHLLPGTQRELGPRQLSLIPPRPLPETHLWSFPSVSKPSPPSEAHRLSFFQIQKSQVPYDDLFSFNYTASRQDKLEARLRRPTCPSRRQTSLSQLDYQPPAPPYSCCRNTVRTDHRASRPRLDSLF